MPAPFHPGPACRSRTIRPASSIAMPSPPRLRRHAAELAARHIREGGMDMRSARNKAATQLGLSLREGHPDLPTRNEIEQALASQLNLFAHPDRPQHLLHKRQAALEAMQFLHGFSPRLSGAVLDGSAQAHDPVIVHLHTDTPEAPGLFLHEQHLPAHQDAGQLQLVDGSVQQTPCWTLQVDGTTFQLWVLPMHALRSPPANPIDGSALPRASASQLQQLIN